MRFHYVMSCMIPAQVQNAAAPEFQKYSAKAAVYGGIQYVEWYYPQHLETWPTSVRFQNGRVSGWE